ncbi:hypothetical protein KO566_09870 [Flavobacteriaceae bacterium XHP0103]|uniref:DUF6048 family protein n=1 Tax=Marixanthotalea marina TaxID=2844359 RepID=UPI002989C64F|nr:DUF6048 family protein [Marixanthotalea marina]MBU3822368.1 hypothetical protein [Marixanthotalea marina]
MKQQCTFIYFISLVFVLCFVPSTNAQNDSIVNTINDSVKIKEKYGLRIGFDAGKLIRSFADEDYSGFELNADFRLKKRLYIAGEIGLEEKNTVTDYLDITTKGTYIKGGLDYNFYQNWLDMDNMIYGGARIGASTFTQTLNSYKIYNTNQYWQPPYSSNQPQEFSGLTALWIEIIFGIKAEIFNNLYIGLNAQLKANISQTEPNNFSNVYIPGFHKTYDTSRIGVGYGYTISYRIPIFKKDK